MIILVMVVDLYSIVRCIGCVWLPSYFEDKMHLNKLGFIKCGLNVGTVTSGVKCE